MRGLEPAGDIFGRDHAVHVKRLSYALEFLPPEVLNIERFRHGTASNSEMSTVLAAARVWRRAAIFGVSSTASIDHAPLPPISPTTTGPEQTPTRQDRVTDPAIFGTAETISKAA